MSEEELYHKIDFYLSGNMSDRESKNFEKEIENDSSLKKEFELHKQLYSHFKEEYISSEIPNNEYIQELNRFIDSDEAKEIREKLQVAKYNHKEQSKKLKPKIYIRLLAATILLIVISRVGYEFIKTPNLYDDYYDLNDLPSLVKRNDSKSQLYNGLEFFNESDYNAAIKSFEAYKTSEIQIDSLMFLYLGASYLQLDQYSLAIENFNVVSNSQLLDKSKGLWFKALTHLKANDIDNAISILEEIVQNPTNFKYNQAQELLKEL